jgi:hypothetical protein
VKSFFFSDQKLSRTIYTALLSVAGALVALLAIGTVYALVRPRDASPLFSLGSPSETERTAAPAQIDDIRVFSDMGRLRIPLTNSSILLLTIAFPYSASDIAFTEELASKIGDFRVIASSYFSSLPVENPIQINEEAAKQEILRRYNAALRLGRIEALYFSDMMVIDGSP